MDTNPAPDPPTPAPIDAHPGLGTLCERCGTPRRAASHLDLCERFTPRPRLWSEGWVPLDAFDLSGRHAVGWPEVVTGPVPSVLYGGLGPVGLRPRTGPWVRCADEVISTGLRVSALAVLRACGMKAPAAVANVLRADHAQLERWCAPRAIVIATTGCGAPHFVRIERGTPPDDGRCRSSARDRGEVLARTKSTATCAQVIERWRGANMGHVGLDVTADADHRYYLSGHDQGVNDAFRIFSAATLGRVRLQHLESGEPDRWLLLETGPGRLGNPALLFPSTRPLPMALITAPPTWLWSDEPVQ